MLGGSQGKDDTRNGNEHKQDTGVVGGPGKWFAGTNDPTTPEKTANQKIAGHHTPEANVARLGSSFRNKTH